MNAGVMKLVDVGLKALPLNAKIGLVILAVLGYATVNVVSVVEAAKNGQGYENDLLHIKIYPKGQDVHVKAAHAKNARKAPPVAAQGSVV